MREGTSGSCEYGGGKQRIMTMDIAEYLSGKKLYGDDFAIEDIRRWYQDEREAYADVYVRPSGGGFRYRYHMLDRLHAWRHIPVRRFEHALGIGSATGDEFLPVLDQISEITILEPSSYYATWNNIQGVPARWIRPEISGDIPFPANAFDLITCLSVLHHIPNVSHVIDECARVLAKDGVLVVREPVISMGDWRHTRPGLTIRERGIPRPLLFRFLKDAGLRIICKSTWSHPLVDVPLALVGRDPYDSLLATFTDALLSRLFAWNYRYHRTSPIHKLAPRAMYLVLRRK